MRFRSLALACAAVVVTVASSARADEETTPEVEPPPPAPEPDKKPRVTPLGYLEAFWAWNFNRPSNGITNYRGFDNRHDSITIQNAVLGATFEAGPVGGKLALQIGSQPASYYQSEPALPGASGANASGPELWRYIQEAFITYKAPVGNGILLQLGVCASPIGYEYMAVKDNWNWSRSNLFFGLPYYHSGLRASYALTDEITAIVSVFNGWNNVVDNNEEKSVEAELEYKDDRVDAQVLYIGGVERNTGSPEGPYWRHHFDAYAQVHATTFLSFAAQGDYGWEPNRFGTARWYTGALYGRVKPVERVYVALRGDYFHEDLATGARGASAPIFFGGAEWVASGTATLEVKPHDNLSVRLEGRHDRAEAPLFFKRTSAGGVSDATRQNTLLVGATAWF